ncbi:MAG: hypothetical protein LUG18_08510 [Candidatus Azobacteroides sp.]|nr:hypothetical protein [Candidatus Azobacteroides sp.]
MKVHIIYKGKLIVLLLALLLLSPALYPAWGRQETAKSQPAYGSTVFDTGSHTSKSASGIFAGARENPFDTGMGKDTEGELNAPPPGIGEKDTPQKILPLNNSRLEITSLLFFTVSFLLLARRKAKRQTA